MKYEFETKIARPIDEVFAYVVDGRSGVEWQPHTESVALVTPGPVRTGSRFRITRRMFGRPVTVETEITRSDPPHSFSVASRSGPLKVGASWHFEGSGEETTARWKLGLEVGPLLRPIEALVTRGMRAELESDLAKLRETLEARIRA
jgi:carbon monoxide dehydrogenase subunit G